MNPKIGYSQNGHGLFSEDAMMAQNNKHIQAMQVWIKLPTLDQRLNTKLLNFS